ncbi:Transposase [Rhodovulum sp. P5]|nr:Transposase [Rhodovulum sp. P5]
MEAAPSRRDRAERKAAMARVLVSLADQGVNWPDRQRLMAERFPDEAVSKPSLKRLLAAVEGVDPINYAPTLLDGHKGGMVTAEMSEDAWRFFMTEIREAAPEWPLKSAWSKVRDTAPEMGWDWPSWPTVWRRWNALDEAQKLDARLGKEATIKHLTQPALRDKTTIGPLEWVSLDGRTLDFWVDWGDGRAVRPVMLVLVDVASNYILDFELAQHENAASTVRLIKRVCERYGIFDRLYTDNGSAFAGHLVAGGNVHRFRNGGRKREGVQPLGICYHLGIKLHFALPRNAKAKIAERTFAALSRAVDDGPEFAGAHEGHKPGSSPSPKVVPVPVAKAEAVLRREVARHNRENGRRSQGANGRSYEQVFNDGLDARIMRKATARQLYLSGLIYTDVAVDRHGRSTVGHWTYGGAGTQQVLLPFHRKRERILLGRDPDDFSAPAIAFEANCDIICEGIEPVKRGAYDSVDGVRDAKRNDKAAKAAQAAAEAANNYLTDQERQAAWAAFEAACAAEDAPPEPPEAVVAGRFGAPLRETAAPAEADEETDELKEFHAGLDALIAAKKKARLGKGA